MPLYGSERDISFFRTINRELLQSIMAIEVLFYKISLKETKSNLYGESKQKFYFDPVKLFCGTNRSDITSTNIDAGTTNNRNISFYFLRDDLKDIQLVPEKGDIILWREQYYEIDNVNENFFITSKQDEYALESPLQHFGESWNLECQAHQTTPNRINITNAR